MGNLANLGYFLLNTPRGILISVILGIALFIIGNLIFYKNRKEKKLRYAINSQNLFQDIANNVELLEIHYKYQPIKNLTVTRIAIWNAGRNTRFKTDINVSNPIMVTIDAGYEILEKKLIEITNISNKIRLENGDSLRFHISFDDLGYHEGCLIRVVHTGKSSAAITVSGSIIGASESMKTSEISNTNILKLGPKQI